MHDGMQYDLIQSQDQSHEPLKVGNPCVFKSYLLRHLLLLLWLQNLYCAQIQACSSRRRQW